MRNRVTLVFEGLLIVGASVALSWQSIDAFAASSHSAPKSAPVTCASAPVASHSAPGAVGKKSAPVSSHSAPCDTKKDKKDKKDDHKKSGDDKGNGKGKH